jgi:hypothetical protein
MRVQTLVGMIPTLPAASIGRQELEGLQRLRKRFGRLLDGQGRELKAWRRSDDGERLLVSVVAPEQLVRVLGTLFDEEAFLSPYGLRSLSRRHVTPYSVPGVDGAVIDYEPAESRTSMYGGNSNWRGPVWFPLNYVAIRSLLQYDQFFDGELTIEYPTGSGKEQTLREIAGDLADRLVAIWVPGPDGHRPVYGGVERFRSDPAWRDNLLFHEYFHGDVGAGLGASHQTGWTALVVDLLLDPPGQSTSFLGGRGAADARRP